MSARDEQIQLINESMETYRQNIQSDIDYLHELTETRQRIDGIRIERAAELRLNLTRMRQVM